MTIIHISGNSEPIFGAIKQGVEVKLILLDCDGVLIDSENLAAVKFIQLLSNRGLNIDEDIWQKELAGLSIKSKYKLIEDKYHKTFSAYDIAEIENEIEQELFLNVQPVPGVINFLQTINKYNLPFCIVSNSGIQRIRRLLQSAGLLSYFLDDHIFSANMVANCKPAPDLFLHAAKAFNCPVANCLVIEDSHIGIGASNAARMKSIAFLGGQHAQNALYKKMVIDQDPNFVCQTMANVVEQLECLVSNKRSTI